MNKILVKLQDYSNYISEFKTNKLDKKNLIYTNAGFPKFLGINEEIFEGRPTDYEVVKNEDSHILIKFLSKKKVEYRFDLFKEPNTNIWHLGFPLFDVELKDYHQKTDKNEAIDIFSRIVWILRDLNHKVDKYCIGATGDESKDLTYQYMMRFVSNWKKQNTTQYNLGWALYFNL
jgi:hypothetical protein